MVEAVAAVVVAVVAVAVAAAAAVEAVAAVVTNAVTVAQRQFAQTATNWLSTRRPIVTHSQQTRTIFYLVQAPQTRLTGTGVPQ